MKRLFYLFLTLLVVFPQLSSGQKYQIRISCPYQNGNPLYFCDAGHYVRVAFDNIPSQTLGYDPVVQTSETKTFYPDIRPHWAQAFYVCECDNKEQSRTKCDFGQQNGRFEEFYMEGYGLYTGAAATNACGLATFKVTITEFAMSYSTAADYGTYMCEGDIMLNFTFPPPYTYNLYITPINEDGTKGETQVLTTIEPYTPSVYISLSELMQFINYNTKYTLTLNNFELSMPPIYEYYPIKDDFLYVQDSTLHIGLENIIENGKISLRSDFYPSQNKGIQPLSTEQLSNGFFSTPLHGPYTITFSEDEHHCPVLRYVFVPEVELNMVNNSNNVFWYEGETRDAVSLHLKYPEKNKDNYRFQYKTNNELKPKKEDDEGKGITFLKGSSGWVTVLDDERYYITESTTCAMEIATFTTDTSLTTIIVTGTSSHKNIIPVYINLKDKLKAYPNISAKGRVDKDIYPHCNYSEAKFTLPEFEGGLQNKYYYQINNSGLIETSNNPITLRKDVKTFTVTIFDVDNTIDPTIDITGSLHRSLYLGTFTVQRPLELRIDSFLTTNPLCNRDSNGIIEITDRQLSYPPELGEEYTWYANPYSEIDKKKLDIEGPKAEGLPAGSYQVELDNNGCTTEEYFTLTEPASLVAKIEEVVHVHCFKEANGSIKASAEGGNVVDKDQKRYSFVWSNGATTQNIDSLPVGRYYLTVTDTKGCKAYANDSIQQPAELFNSLTPEYIICKGGELAIDDGKDNPRLFTKYEWIQPDGTIKQGRPIVVDSTMPQGQYILKSINEDNCFTLDTTYIHFADTDLPIRFLVPTESFLADTLVIAEDSEIDKPFSWYYTYNKEMFSDITNQVASFNPNLTFLYVDHSGNDTITMFAHDGLCTVSLSKNITISPEFRPEDYNYTVDAAGIFSRLQIGPNPNNGNFTLFANLIEDAPLSIALYDVSRSRKIPLNFNKYKTSTSRYQIPFQGLGLQSGIYTLLVSANGETKQIKFVVE